MCYSSVSPTLGLKPRETWVALDTPKGGGVFIEAKMVGKKYSEHFVFNPHLFTSLSKVLEMESVMTFHNAPESRPSASHSLSRLMNY
jgi:hypothetical protein